MTRLCRVVRALIDRVVWAAYPTWNPCVRTELELLTKLSSDITTYKCAWDISISQYADTFHRHFIVRLQSRLGCPTSYWHTAARDPRLQTDTGSRSCSYDRFGYYIKVLSGNSALDCLRNLTQKDAFHCRDTTGLVFIIRQVSTK
jgi:hypothetical protein